MIPAVLISLILVPVVIGLYREFVRQKGIDALPPLSDEHVLRILNTTIDKPRRARKPR